jgi:hypothetical protein
MPLHHSQEAVVVVRVKQPGGAVERGLVTALCLELVLVLGMVRVLGWVIVMVMEKGQGLVKERKVV